MGLRVSAKQYDLIRFFIRAFFKRFVKMFKKNTFYQLTSLL